MSEKGCRCEPQVRMFYFLSNNNLLGGLQSLKYTRNPTLTRKQNKNMKLQKKEAWNQKIKRKITKIAKIKAPGWDPMVEEAILSLL
jgi:hypothetical protein